MSKIRAFTSTTQVIEALGGNTAVAALTGRQPSAVSNWHGADHFPSNTFVLMGRKLQALGIEAPDWLWDMGPRAHRKPRRAKIVATIEAA
jgi:hypothetical protein